MSRHDRLLNHPLRGEVRAELPSPRQRLTEERMTADAAVEALAAFPRGVTDPFCPRGDVIETSTDHRILWHVEMKLSGSGDADTRELGRAIHRYLNAACEHHWHSYKAEEYIPAHDQCLWCNDVVWHDTEAGGGS